ncbi:hypothetical protein Btru_057473 [Bulinus truncatus]|nr:hypothetical protein Btru_057473 [Bulinus truncatus]
MFKVHKPRYEADQLKESGVKLITVGVGQDSVSELLNLASSPEYVLAVTDFDQLEDLEYNVTCLVKQIMASTALTTESSSVNSTLPITSMYASATTSNIKQTEPASTTTASLTNSSLNSTTSASTDSLGISTYSVTTTIESLDSSSEIRASSSLPSTGITMSSTDGLKADIILLLDASTSVGMSNWKTMTELASNFVQNFIFGPDNVLFGSVVFSKRATSLFRLNTYSYLQNVSDALLSATYPETSSRNTDQGLAEIINLNLFGSSAGGRVDAQDIVVLITNGVSRYPEETLYEADQLKESGVKLITVGVGQDSMHELMRIASDTEYVLEVNDFGQLEDVESNLTILVKRIMRSNALSSTTTISSTTTTTSLPNVETSQQNTATEKNTTSVSVEDTPPPLPEDVVISCGNSTKADIIFLLDASSSIGATNWRKQLKFASDLVEEFSFGPTGNLFGAVIFTSTPTKIFDLNTYLNKTAVARAILEIPYPNTVGTYTDAALAFIRTNHMFGTSSGGRENAQNILIVMTDGQSYFPTLTISEAQKLKDAGVSIVAVGIGLTDLIELNAVASQNSFVFTASSFDVLSTINESLLKITCDIQLRKDFTAVPTTLSTASPSTDSPSTASPSTATTQTTPQTSTISSSAVITTTSISSSSPTVTSSTSISSSGQAETSMATASPSSTTQSTSGSITVEDTPPPLPEDVVISCGNSTKADIIFLLDASSSIGATNWRKQLKFASDLVEEFSFGPTGNLFGAVIFTSTPTKIFDLNTYLNKTAVARAILEIPYPNTVGTYTDAALAFIRTNDMFGTSSGGRENAQNILIVMTDGQSYFPTLTISEAQKLKDAGVSIVAVGIGLTDLIELNAVASQNSFVFTASSFDVLSTINESLLKITCDISNGNVSELSTTSFDASSTTTQDFTAVPTTLSTASPSTDSPSTASPSTATTQTTPQTSTISSSAVITTTSISSSSPTVTSSTSISSSGQAETSMATASPSSTTQSTSGSITVEDTPPPLPEDVVISCGNSTKADIIFLLDASSSIGATNWRKQLKFSSDLVEEFSFGPTGNLFGAVIFTSTPTKIFDLNTYLNKTTVARLVLTLTLHWFSLEPTICLEHHQVEEKNAQNILIVMTDGQSYFPTLTISEAQKLKDAGVSIVAIGIGLTDLKELNAVASQTGFVFTASSFDVLSTINESLLKITCDSKLKIYLQSCNLKIYQN